MIDFSEKTYSKILSEMLAQVSSEYDKRDTSPIMTAEAPAAYALEEFYLMLNRVQKAGYIDYAEGSDLDELAVLGGISRNAATPAVRLSVFNQSVSIGDRFSTIDGNNSIVFAVTAAYTGSVSYAYELTAETAGIVGNSYTGNLLPVTAISGLTSAVMSSVLVPGEDEETDEALRTRLKGVLVVSSFGGNVTAYKKEVEAMDGVGGAQIYPTWNGGGTVKISVIDSDDYSAASSSLVSQIQEEIDPSANQGNGIGIAPIGAVVTVVAPTELSVNVSATVTLDTGYTIAQMKTAIESAIGAYLLKIRKAWATNRSLSGVQYSANVYAAQVISAILGVEHVANVTNLTLNGASSDLTLTETGTTQQLPMLGTVTLNE